MANEKRLIDANALKDMFDAREADDVELYGGVRIVECFPADDAKEMVDKMPTVDAVEVVRCKECANGYKSSASYTGMRCKKWGCYDTDCDCRPDDFCSHGERRTDG